MYNQVKATQMAARFVELAGGPVNYVKLLKLMYLADRAMLTRHGKPVTYDRWVRMKHGPVLSATYDLIKGSPPGYWGAHLQTNGFCVERVAESGTDDLSPAEQDAILDTFMEYGRFDTWALRDITHGLDEWQDPGSTSVPLTYREVLEVEGLGADEVAAVLENIAAQDVMDRVLQAA